MRHQATTTTALVPPQFAPGDWPHVVKSLRLSPQQANIVCLILQGRRDKAIQKELGLSHSTVRSHLSTIFARLDVQDRTDLVLRIFATRDGIASRSPSSK